MKVIEKSGHNEMCGGYSYTYDVEYFGHTLKEVLKEIKEFTNNDERFVKIDEYGYSPNVICGAWAIHINDKIYKSAWIKQSWDKYFTDEIADQIVKSVKGSGGWYCAIDFYITLD
jgi:hypothetical protein